MIKLELPLHHGERVVAAVSGGVDSVALLYALIDAGYCVTVAHYEHGIRGQDSRDDAAFVEALCADLGVECASESGDVPAYAAQNGMGPEEAAREMRYAFLRSVANERGIAYIATGHHALDQAETLLMHAFRGCAPGALKGMMPTNGDIIRPLLHTSRDEILAFMRDVKWREDATNLDLMSARSRIRHEVLPAAERIYPGAVNALNRLSHMSTRDDAYFTGLVSEEMNRRFKLTPIGGMLTTIDDSPPALAGRIYAQAAVRVGLLPDCANIEALLNGAHRVEMKGGAFERGYTRWHILKNRVVPEMTWQFDTSDVNQRGVSDAVTQYVDRDAVLGVILRYRLPGDVIMPIGSSGTKKLSDYFIDRKVDRALRDHIPILAKESRVMWVMGVGLSGECAVREHTKDIVRWRITGEVWWI